MSKRRKGRGDGHPRNQSGERKANEPSSASDLSERKKTSAPLTTEWRGFGYAAGFVANREGVMRFPQAVTVAPAVLAFALSLAIGTGFAAIQERKTDKFHDLQKQASLLHEKAMGLWSARDITPNQRNEELARLSDEGKALEEAAMKISGLFFKKLYFPVVLFMFGCNVGIAMAGIWPLYSVLYSPRDERLVAGLAAVAVFGLGIGQLVNAIRALAGETGGQHGELIVCSLQGAAYGLGAGVLFGIAIYVPIALLCLRTTRPKFEQEA